MESGAAPGNQPGRARRSLDDLDPWLPASAGAHLRSGGEQLRRFARYPGVVELAAEVGRAAAFDLSLVAPSLPPYPCPDGPDGQPLPKSAAASKAPIATQDNKRSFDARPKPSDDRRREERARPGQHIDQAPSERLLDSADGEDSSED